MTLFQSVVLGIIQGVAEFLPISSSAHLIIVPWILNWDDGGLTFDVALHAGTLIALLIFFRSEWIALLKALLKFRPGDLKILNSADESQNLEKMELKMALFIIIGTIPGALIGLLLEKKAEHTFRSPTLVATNLAIMGFILWVCDRKGSKSKSFQELTLKDVLLIGIAQGLAVIPGISRAGVTISTALAQGMNRETAARFSFYLSMPIIAGACMLKLRHLTGADLTPAFLSGVAAAAISGYFAIGGLIRFLQRQTYGIFAGYRLLLATIVWIVAFSR